jgi:hypothetical protein
LVSDGLVEALGPDDYVLAGDAPAAGAQTL